MWVRLSTASPGGGGGGHAVLQWRVQAVTNLSNGSREVVEFFTPNMRQLAASSDPTKLYVALSVDKRADVERLHLLYYCVTRALLLLYIRR